MYDDLGVEEAERVAKEAVCARRAVIRDVDLRIRRE
jgi:hypothetical protein